MSKRHALGLALVLAAAVLQAACGFQLQGRQVVPARLAVVQLDATDRQSDFTRALRKSLTAAGASLVERGAAEGAVVKILRDEVTERVLSVDARNIPTDYELIYEVEIEVRQAGELVMQAEPFTQSRIYSFDESKKLPKEREKEVLRAALARDMAGVVLRRLASL